MRSELRAEQLGAAALQDSQLAVPLYPVLRLGVRLRPAQNIIVLDGSDRAQAFTGTFANKHLLAITSLCDGHHTHLQIAETLGLDESTITAALALLWSAGAIEEATQADHQLADKSLAVFLSRLGNSTGSNSNWSVGYDKLLTKPIRLMGDCKLVAEAKKALENTCLIRDAEDEIALTIYFETSQSTIEDRTKASTCDSPLLRIRADSRSVTIGPYVDRKITPCLTCASVDDSELDDVPLVNLSDLIVGLAGHHIVSLLAHATSTHLPGDIVDIQISDLSMKPRAVISLSGCQQCSFSAHEPPSTSIPIGARYEASVELPPRAFLSPRDHQAHYYTGNQELQSQFREWPGRTRTPLPEVQASGLSSGTTNYLSQPLNLISLSHLLMFGFGIDYERSNSQRIKRWTASGGNIGSTLAYVIIRDSSLFRVGTYAYAADTHSLVFISTSVTPGETSCELVVVGDLQKVMSKYGTFGLRLVFLDAGCNLTTLWAVSRELGVTMNIHPNWNDAELATVLGIDLQDGPIAAVVSLGGLNEN